jgi:hypothetical protein
MKTTFFMAALVMLAMGSPLHAELKFEQTRKQVAAGPKDWGARSEFAYKNIGKEAVQIVEAKAGCSCCTKVKATVKNVLPGGSGEIQVRVSLAKKTLPYLRPVMVTTSDGKMTVLLLEVVAAK